MYNLCRDFLICSMGILLFGSIFVSIYALQGYFELEYPYEVKSELRLVGYAWSGDAEVECALKAGDKLHSIDIDSDIVRLPGLSRYDLFRIEQVDRLASGCILDNQGILLLAKDLIRAIRRDKYLTEAAEQLDAGGNDGGNNKDVGNNEIGVADTGVVEHNVSAV